MSEIASGSPTLLVRQSSRRSLSSSSSDSKGKVCRDKQDFETSLSSPIMHVKGGEEIHDSLFFSREEEARNPGNQVYIGGLSSNCTKDDLEQRFGKYGPFEECSVVTDPHRSECRGFGFVRYLNNNHAVEAISTEHGTVFHGRVLTVQFSKRNCARPKTPGMYLGQRPDEGFNRYRDFSPGRRRHERSPYSRHESRSGRHERSRYENDDRHDKYVRGENAYGAGDRHDRTRGRERSRERGRDRSRDHHYRDRSRSRSRSRDRERRSRHH